MFISKKFIPRRTFLQGAGITIGLPLLDSMVPAQTPLNQTAAAPVKRFMAVWHPHGAAPGYWSPLQEGANFDLSFITKPLEPFRNRLTLISGMDMPEAMATTEEPGGDHARGAVLLSAMRPRRNAVSPYLGVTVDQLIAKKYGRDTILESIQVGVEEDGNYGNCNWGYSCAYTNSRSHAEFAPLSRFRRKSTHALRSSACSAMALSPEERRRLGRKREREHSRFRHAGDRVFQEAAGRRGQGAARHLSR